MAGDAGVAAQGEEQQGVLRDGSRRMRRTNLYIVALYSLVGITVPAPNIGPVYVYSCARGNGEKGRKSPTTIVM